MPLHEDRSTPSLLPPYLKLLPSEPEEFKQHHNSIRIFIWEPV